MVTKKPSTKPVKKAGTKSTKKSTKTRKQPGTLEPNFKAGKDL
jgi:hypothetical protein